MNDIKKISKKEQKRKEFREYIDITDKRILDTQKHGIELLEKGEVFILVNKTNNYWISNYGRLINNLRGKFYIHKMGNPHFTITGTSYKIETYMEKLVAEHFLENTDKSKYCMVWHIDEDKDNCFYKNLMWVSQREYMDLKSHNITVKELNRQQEYLTYIMLKSNTPYSIWAGIYSRCYVRQNVYDGSFMCDLWLNDKDVFAEWYNSEYYEVDGESMAVDKDLLCPGNKEYAPDKCCLIPQSINTMLSNCKKHKLAHFQSKQTVRLPLGVRCCSSRNMYYGEIKPYGYDEVIKLSYWKTPEEAFEEYKKHKQADILMMADKYKNKIPKKVYDALLKVEVKPY